jgi:hypothetical protein
MKQRSLEEHQEMNEAALKLSSKVVEQIENEQRKAFEMTLKTIFRKNKHKTKRDNAAVCEPKQPV